MVIQGPRKDVDEYHGTIYSAVNLEPMTLRILCKQVSSDLERACVQFAFAETKATLKKL